MKAKVLLVDDSSTALLMGETIFKKHTPYKVVTARGGEEGVQKALAEKPDLILMDVVMPKMDGFAACREIRKQEVLKSVPIIMVTSRGESSNVEMGYRSGCNAYLTKPICASELLEMVKMLLGSDGKVSRPSGPVMTSQTTLNEHASTDLRPVADVLGNRTAEFLKQSLEDTPNLGAWTKLYAASQTLLSAMREDRVIAALLEICSNLLGCEELAIVEMMHHTGTVHFLGEAGLSPERRKALILNEGIVEARITSGSAWVPCSDSWQSNPALASLGISALVPLWRDQRSIAAIVLLQLLPQRGGFDSDDREVLQLLSLYAGPCLRSQTL